MEFNNKKFIDGFRLNGTLDMIISTENLQAIQDQFSAAHQCGILLLDNDGKNITRPSSFDDGFLSNESVSKLIKREHGSMVCEEINGTAVAAVPLIAKGKHFGNFIVHASEEFQPGDKGVFLESVSFLALILDTLMKSGFSAYESRTILEERLKIDEDLEKKNEALKHKNDYDEMTGIYSRSYFNEKCAEIEKSENPLLCVVMGDVNKLKITNDLFGHRHGDYLLKTIAKVMQEEADPNYIVARCGGDEINVLMPNALRREADWYCHRVRRRLAEIVDCCTTPSISMGVGKRSEFSQSVKETINIADVKMYRIKVDYKNHLNITEDIYNVLLRRGFLTEDYTKRVAELGDGFCRYLSSNEQTISHMKLLSWMHELGATMLTDKVYFKSPEDRTLLETREVHKHSDIGAKIAMLHSETEDIADIILQLHGRWDGRGYPRSMKGSQIRPLARILQVVTEYSRMVEPSRMGGNMSSKQAKQQLLAGAGTLYDPGMVDVFIQYLDSIGK